MIVEKQLAKFLPKDIREPLLQVKVKKADRISFVVDKDKVIFTTVEGEKPPQPIRLASFLQKNLGIAEGKARTTVEAVTAKILVKDEAVVEVVKGEDLRWCYHGSNYIPASKTTGNLRSCMSYPEEQQNLDFYVYNEDAFQLAVIKSKGLVAGRALLYNAAEMSTTLDRLKLVGGRVYAAGGKYENLLKDWIKEHCDYYMNNALTYIDDKWIRKLWYVPVKHWNMNYYPYLDNDFNRIMKPAKDRDFGVLTNRKVRQHFILPEHGGFQDSSGDTTPRPHPIDPELHFVQGKWARDVVQWRGINYAKEDTEECAECGLRMPKYLVLKLLGTRTKICGEHGHARVYDSKTASYAYINKEDAVKCVSCGAWTTEGKICHICSRYYDICTKCDGPKDKGRYSYHVCKKKK